MPQLFRVTPDVKNKKTNAAQRNEVGNESVLSPKTLFQTGIDSPKQIACITATAEVKRALTRTTYLKVLALARRCTPNP